MWLKIYIVMYIKYFQIKRNTTLEVSSQKDNQPLMNKEKENIITKTDGWGWGWGVDSLLSSATAGISTITSQVSQVIFKLIYRSA